MDSVTQAALGASVAVVVMRDRQPIWKSALIGAVLGTLPDLDVLIDHGDPVSDTVLHRAETHAFFWQWLVSPLFAAVLMWLTRSRELFGRWTLLVAAVFVTHALCDAMTVYGTQLLLPFSNQPLGSGSLFIIDPLYTVPIVIGLFAALLSRKAMVRRLRWNDVGLGVSVVYALWALAAQAHVKQVVMAQPEVEGIAAEQVLVVPTPFNTVLWRVVLRKEQTYAEGFYSLLDDEPVIRFRDLARGGELEADATAIPAVQQLQRFTAGFYALAVNDPVDDDAALQVTDLRMGQHPFYVFSFTVAQHENEQWQAITPELAPREFPGADSAGWLWQRLLGNQIPSPEALTD